MGGGCRREKGVDRRMDRREERVEVGREIERRRG